MLNAVELKKQSLKPTKEAFKKKFQVNNAQMNHAFAKEFIDSIERRLSPLSPKNPDRNKEIAYLP